MNKEIEQLKVKIISCDNPQSWYKDLIGKTITVTQPKEWRNFYQKKGESIGYLIYKKDTQIVK